MIQHTERVKGSLAEGVDGCDVEQDSYELSGGTHWTAGADGAEWSGVTLV